MLAGARFAQQELHRRVSTVTLAFLAGHVLTSVLDTYVPIGWAAVVVPFASSHKRLWVAVGAVGLDLMLAVAAISAHLVAIARQAARDCPRRAFVLEQRECTRAA